jgi:2-iminobutanoate/2-iminopropanoate deaminase
MSNTFRRSVVLCSIALMSLSIPGAVRAQATRQAVVPAGQSASATLTPGIRYGDVLYVSGQLGTSRTAPDSTIQGETQRALEKVKGVVEAAGSTMSNVLKCTVFLVNVADFQGMNQAYTQFFPKEPPARSTVVVAALVSPAAKVEIECIAALK